MTLGDADLTCPTSRVLATPLPHSHIDFSVTGTVKEWLSGENRDFSVQHKRGFTSWSGASEADEDQEVQLVDYQAPNGRPASYLSYVSVCVCVR